MPVLNIISMTSRLTSMGKEIYEAKEALRSDVAFLEKGSILIVVDSLYYLTISLKLPGRFLTAGVGYPLSCCLAKEFLELGYSFIIDIVCFAF